MNFESIEKLKSDSRITAIGGVTKEMIQKAEKVFQKHSLQIPKTYKSYLKEFGGGNFNSYEIAGLQAWADEHCTVPIEGNILEHLDEAIENGSNHIEILSYEGDEGYYFDISNKDILEYPVVYVDNINGSIEPFADSFELFLIELIKRG